MQWVCSLWNTTVICALLIWILPLDCSAAVECPSSCKCSPVEESQPGSGIVSSGGSNPLGKVPIMARCWIPANLVHLPCSKSWTIVHLQILTGQPQSDQMTGSLSTRSVGRHSYANISVSPKLFDQCASLTRLAIWERSQFTWLPQYWLRPLVKLERLFIEVPTLTSLPDHFFAFLPRLNFVKISKCSQLTRISRAVFEPCPETLHTLWLDGNGLRGKLPSGVFRQCSFRMMHLSENQLTQLDWGSLSGLKHLQSLHLQRNRLTGSLEQSLSYRQDMNSAALVATPMLKKLDVSFNQIDSVEGMTWSGECVRPQEDQSEGRGLCHLEELDLSHNKLTWLGLDSFKGLPRLRRLNLDANPSLFSPEGSANLALVLHAVSTFNRYFQNLIIPVQSTDPSQHRARSNGSVNLCQPDEGWLNQAPRYMAMVVRQVKESSCNRQPNSVEFPLESTVDQPASITSTESSNKPDNMTLSNQNPVSSTDENSDPIIAFLRRTNRFNLLILCLGLIFIGLLIGLLPMTYFLCTPKPKDTKHKPIPSAAMIPLLAHPNSQGGFILPGHVDNLKASSPNGSVSSPLPKRSMKNGRNGALPPVPPTRVQFATSRVPLMHGSADPIRARPFVQQIAMPNLQTEPVPITTAGARRVLSTSNVYHRTRPQSGPHAPHHRYDRLVPQDSPIPMEMRPVNPTTQITTSDVPYCPTEDTVVSGSTYSLATVTSFRNRSPAKGGTIVPASPPAVA